MLYCYTAKYEMKKGDVSTEAWHRVEGVTAAAEEVCSRQPLNILASAFRASGASQVRSVASQAHSVARSGSSEPGSYGEAESICPKT